MRMHPILGSIRAPACLRAHPAQLALLKRLPRSACSQAPPCPPAHLRLLHHVRAKGQPREAAQEEAALEELRGHRDQPGLRGARGAEGRGAAGSLPQSDPTAAAGSNIEGKAG